MKDDPMQRKPDIDRAKNLLDWTPEVSLEIGLEKTINWMKGLKNV
jgi:nucleoside-diphosphate-sugar epimerase